MKDSLFDTDKKREDARATFEVGVTTPFWLLMKKVLRANIKNVSSLILDGKNVKGGKATEEETERLRDRLRIYRKIKDTPESLLERLSATEVEEPNPDPYPTLESLKAERKKISED